MEIYEDSHQNYGASKITECLRQQGECIAEKNKEYKHPVDSAFRSWGTVCEQ
jgi:hypothetical protein